MAGARTGAPLSFACDASILLYASNVSSPHHLAARRFVESSAAGRETFCLTWSTALAYLRIATHPSIFPSPLAPAEARANLEALQVLPHVRFLGVEPELWPAWDRATKGVVVRGNGVPDAELAATLLQHGVRVLYTNDRDFLRYPMLEVRNPLEAASVREVKRPSRRKGART